MERSPRPITNNNNNNNNNKKIDAGVGIIFWNNTAHTKKFPLNQLKHIKFILEEVFLLSYPILKPSTLDTLSCG